jgi:hypothetical protein
VSTIRSGLIGLLFATLGVACSHAQKAPAPALKTRNVVLIVADGLRWQEIFTGAEEDLMNDKAGGIWAKPEGLRKQFWREDVQQRREALFPFLWGTMAKQGQIFGDRSRGSDAHVINGQAFSYPGYNEMSTGHPDPRIDSNEFGPNPNLNVFEWLNGLPEFHNQVAIYATWNVFKNIFNEDRSHLIMQVGWDPPYKGTLTASQLQLNDLFRTTTQLDDEDVYDSFLQIPLLEYVRSHRPRVLFVGYGETDNWAHAGRYDLVLQSAHAFDQYVAELWNTMQSIPAYRGQTTFIITTDHGRGSGLEEWKEHGADQKGSENIWLAVIGPDTASSGDQSNPSPIIQAQIAATIAALLGKDFRRAVPQAAAPIPYIFPHSNPD